MNSLEFQKNKIELAKSVLDIENEEILRKIQKFLLEEKKENQTTYKKREESPKHQVQAIQDVNGVRRISANDFVIKLS